MTAPVDYWNYHHPDCGTRYRGCAPECPKDVFERTGEWIGPLAQRTPEQIAKQFRDEFIYTSDYGFEAALALALRSYGASYALAQRERDAWLAIEGAFDIGCTAAEATGVVSRTREAIAAAIRGQA